MTDPAQDYGPWRIEQQRRAQASAIAWAERATAAYSEAVRHEDTARRNAGSAYLRDTAAEDRRQAQIHGVRSTEALKLAEMWASVARALADGDLPVTYTLDMALKDPKSDLDEHSRASLPGLGRML
ncbi:hypothetical protein ACWEQC_32710 [Streptomyces shenzhenensis]